MKIRITKVEKFDCGDKKIETYYHIERKYWFFWSQLLHPCLTSLEEAESWAENYIRMRGKEEKAVVVKEYSVE